MIPTLNLVGESHDRTESVWPEVVFYHQSGVLGHLCGAEILAVVFSLKRVTFQF